MRRIFVSPPATALCIAAGLGFLLIAPDADAASQPPDAGGQPAYAQQTSYGGGFFEFLFDGGRQPVARMYQAPQSGPAASAPQPRGLFQSLQWAPAPPAPADQGAPEYDPSAAPQQSAANNPAAGYAPAGVGHMAHAVDPQFDRQVVDYHGGEKPGTIIIDTPHYFLYLVGEDGKALRYGIGVGRRGFTWSGVKEISRQARVAGFGGRRTKCSNAGPTCRATPAAARLLRWRRNRFWVWDKSGLCFCALGLGLQPLFLGPA